MNNEARHVREGRTTAQALIELAVFGAVLFFVIGGIANNYLSSSYQQNAQLQAMRRALLSSYTDSQKGLAAHASGSFLIYEDRLTGEFGKFGTVDRQPVVASGNGTLSAQTMQTSDFNDPDALAVMDLVVNGEQFVLRTDAYAIYYIVLRSDNKVQIMLRDPRMPYNTGTHNVVTGPGKCVYRIHGGETTGVDKGKSCYTTDECVDTHNTDVSVACEGVQYTTVQGSTPDEDAANSIKECLKGAKFTAYLQECNFGNQEQLDRLAREWTGPLAKQDDLKNMMPPFFTAIPANDPDFEKKPQGDAGSQAYNLTRKANGALFPKDGAIWPSWRWSWVYFWEQGEVKKDADGNDLEPEKSLQQQFADNELTMISYDIDGDLKEEALFGIRDVSSLAGRPAYMVKVRDSQIADIDSTRSPKDFVKPEQKPGMRPDFRIYGRTACVETTAAACADSDITSLDVKEGKLYSDGKQVAVSVLKKSQYDVIERAYQLNVDMTDVAGFISVNKKNGQEIAYGCVGENIKGTCFDPDTKTLYIRSRLNDKRGHKWITDTDKRTWNQSLGGK